MRILPLPFFLLLCSPGWGQNWPQFRGPGASGLGEGQPPMRWDELLSTSALDDLCFATPAVAGDMLIARTRSHLYGIAAFPRK